MTPKRKQQSWGTSDPCSAFSSSCTNFEHAAQTICFGIGTFGSIQNERGEMRAGTDPLFCCDYSLHQQTQFSNTKCRIHPGDSLA